MSGKITSLTTDLEKNMQNMNSKKNLQFEYIRAFSVMAVIIIHTFYSALLKYGSMASIQGQVLYKIIMNMMWWAVPSFLMMSGSLLLDVKKLISLKKLYGKYISRMLIVLFTFGVAFSWLEIVFDEKIVSILQIPHALLSVLSGNTWAHMWYIYCLIGLYVFLPMYKIIVDIASDEQLEYILFVLFVFESVFVLTKMFGIDLGFSCHVNTIYPFWFLMGGAWNRGMFKRGFKLNLLVFVISSAVLIISSVLWTTVNLPIGCLFGYDSPIVVAQSVALFSMFNALKIGPRLSVILLKIADKSFGIYLIHMFFVNVIFKLIKFNPLLTYPILSGVVLVLINLVISYITVSVMRLFPGIKKII